MWWWEERDDAAAAAKSLQLCLTLCDPIDGSPPGFSVPGILHARTLEWVAISFSNAWKWKVKVKSLSRVQLSATPWTTAYQAPPSMGFSRQEYWCGLPLPSPERDGSYHLFLRVCPLVFGLYIYTQAYLKLVKEISLSFWHNDSQIFAYFRIIREPVKKQNDVPLSPSWISDLVGWDTFPISSQMILMLLVGNHAPYTLF